MNFVAESQIFSYKDDLSWFMSVLCPSHMQSVGLSVFLRMLADQWQIQPFHLRCVCVCVGGGGAWNEIEVNAKGTVGSFGERKLIYNKIITRKI